MKPALLFAFFLFATLPAQAQGNIDALVIEARMPRIIFYRFDEKELTVPERKEVSFMHTFITTTCMEVLSLKNPAEFHSRIFRDQTRMLFFDWNLCVRKMFADIKSAGLMPPGVGARFYPDTEAHAEPDPDEPPTTEK